MNKGRPIQEVLFTIMRFTFTQMLIMVALTSLVSAAPWNSNAQQILERKVSLNVKDKEIKSVLMEIEEQASVIFTYRPRPIQSTKKVTINVENATLESVLIRLFDNHVTWLALDDEEEIVLKPMMIDDSRESDAILLDVSGKVTDENGDGLPGVNVIEKGTTNGTTTDINGMFSLGVRDENSILVFSFIGYAAQEVRVGNQTTFNISLEPDIQSLQEVVVVGYGERDRATLTGSVADIKGAELTKSPQVNVTSNLAGRLPGLIVNQSTGTPGSENINILIRGASTWGDNNPLIVIDGVPRDNLQRLNPDDIESISVLKDASAAIYGARAANGVILVTTKQGSSSKPAFNVSYNLAYTQPTKIPDMLDAATFAEVMNEADIAAGSPPRFSQEDIQKYRDGSDPLLHANTDWADVTTKKWATQQRVNLQASGGSENVRYLLSLGLSDQGGNFRNVPIHYRQYNTRIRVDADLTESLTVGANLNGIFNNREDGQGYDFVGMLRSDPTLVAIYPNGLIAPGRFRDSPLLSNRRGFNRTQDYPIYTTFTAEYRVPFVEGLKLNLSYNYDLRNQFNKNFNKPHYWHEYNSSTGEYDRIENQEPITLSDTYQRWTQSLFNFRASYGTTVAINHNIGIMLGAEQQKNSSSNANAYRQNFVSPAVPQINVGSSDPNDIRNGGSASESARLNYFGRINYDFQSKYLAEFVFRYEGSQNFPSGKRFGFFPSISAGWRISEESFFNVPAVNQLKLRASYGEVGNDRVSQWQYLQAFQFGSNYVFGGSDAPGIFSSTLPNPDITWEVSKKLDVGLDARLWGGKLGVDFTFYSEKRRDILRPRNFSIPQAYGFPDIPDQNIGQVDNHGFELILTHQNSIGELRYNLSANTSFARSKVIYMDETPPAEAYMAQTGRPLNSGLYYKSDGIFNTQEELDAAPIQPNGTSVGDIKIVDLNDDGVINGNDRYQTYASPTPEFVFGLSSNFEYKGFDLTLFFQGQARGFTYDGTLTELGEFDLDNNVVYRAKNRWTPDNQVGATMPRSNMFKGAGATDFFLYNTAFIRLKNVELGYNFSNLLPNSGFNSIRVYVSGTNLLTWAKEISWRDPEINGGFATYPPLRIINFGVNVGF